MSDNRNIPKNVESFINKYGNLGSRQQDSAFWKEFRKAANAYADTQAHRICDLERQLAELTSRIRKWHSMSDAEMRLRCGELSAQDIRNIKAVLESIMRTLSLWKS